MSHRVTKCLISSTSAPTFYHFSICSHFRCPWQGVLHHWLVHVTFCRVLWLEGTLSLLQHNSRPRGASYSYSYSYSSCTWNPQASIRVQFFSWIPKQRRRSRMVLLQTERKIGTIQTMKIQTNVLLYTSHYWLDYNVFFCPKIIF